MSAGESDALHHIHCSGGPERTTAAPWRATTELSGLAILWASRGTVRGRVWYDTTVPQKGDGQRERERYYCINHHQDYHISGSLKGGSLKASVACRKWDLALPTLVDPSLMGM